MRSRIGILLLSVAVGCLVFGVWKRNARRLEIQSHLRGLEFWGRRQFGKSDWTDLFSPQAWSQLGGPQADAQKEAEKEYNALLSLGYLTNQSFVLLAVATNQADFASLQQRVLSAAFSDAHWRYGLRSNRVEALISVTDVPRWEELIRTWDHQRLGLQPDGSANGSQPIG